MNFIDAVIAIHERTDLELCDDANELSGIRKGICVFKDDIFIGKLRWSIDGEPASVDESVIAVLNCAYTHGEDK